MLEPITIALFKWATRFGWKKISVFFFSVIWIQTQLIRNSFFIFIFICFTYKFRIVLTFDTILVIFYCSTYYSLFHENLFQKQNKNSLHDLITLYLIPKNCFTDTLNWISKSAVIIELVFFFSLGKSIVSIVLKCYANK